MTHYLAVERTVTTPRLAPWVCNWARGRGAIKALADGRRKVVDCGEVRGGNRLEAVVGTFSVRPRP